MTYRFPFLLLLGGLFALLACATPSSLPDATEQALTAAVSPLPTASATPLPTIDTLLLATDTPRPPTVTATPTTVPPAATATPIASAMPAATATVPTDSVIEDPNATLPDGFSLVEFAALPRPTGFTFDSAGRLWAVNFFGELWVFEDRDGDGRADSRQKVAFGFDQPVGVAVDERDGSILISQAGKITRVRDTDGDLIADEFDSPVSGLPYDLHKNNNIEFGPDGMLYVGVGSTCNACEEVDARSATIMRFDPETWEGEVIATGLRNSFDFAFDPISGELFATENGRDDLGQNAPLEELNLIREGVDYGWPDCWGRFEGSNCETSEIAVAFFEPHSSINGAVFYEGERFPAEYHNNLFITVFGSWQYAVGHGIHRVQLEPRGDSYAAEVEWFLQTEDWLLPIVVGPDGALYYGTYDINLPEVGSIYRISYGLP